MQMSPQNALNMLNQIVGSIPMKREEHLAVIGAVNVLQNMITPPPEFKGPPTPVMAGVATPNLKLTGIPIEKKEINDSDKQA